MCVVWVSSRAAFLFDTSKLSVFASTANCTQNVPKESLLLAELLGQNIYLLKHLIWAKNIEHYCKVYDKCFKVLFCVAKNPNKQRPVVSGFHNPDKHLLSFDEIVSHSKFFFRYLQMRDFIRTAKLVLVHFWPINSKKWWWKIVREGAWFLKCIMNWWLPLQKRQQRSSSSGERTYRRNIHINKKY